MSPMWSRPTRYLVVAGLVLFGIFVLYLSRPVLPLLVMAAVLSFLLLPLINFLHHGVGMPRGLAVILTYLTGLSVFALALLLLIPAVVDAVQFVLGLDYVTMFEETIQIAREWLLQLQAAEIPFPPLDSAVNEAATALLESLAGAVPPVIEVGAVTPDLVLQQLGSLLVGSFNLLSGAVGTLLSRLVTLIFVILASVYISLDAHKLKPTIVEIAPAQYRPEVNTLLERVYRVWTLFLRGQLTLMILIGVIVWLGLSFLGLPYAWVMGVLAGLLEIVPNIGPVVAAIPAVIVALLDGSSVLEMSHFFFALVVVLFYVVVQQVENSLIVPRLLGNAVDLHPVVVMGGILAGASLAGLLGALLAVPVIASMKEIVSYLYRKAMGMEPFPVEEAPPAPDERASRWQAVRAWLERFRAQTGPATGADDHAALRVSAGPPEEPEAPHSDAEILR